MKVFIRKRCRSRRNLGNGMIETNNFDLEQKAHHVAGKAVIIKTSHGKERIETMEIEGEIKDRFFNAVMKTVNKKRICNVSFLLEIVGDGSRMLGASSWYDIGRSHIICEQINFKRA